MTRFHFASAIVAVMLLAALFGGHKLFAQELRTLTNGSLADAEDLNHNFTQLNNAIGAASGASPFDPARHVILNDLVLSSSPCTDDRAFVRVNLDGSPNSTEFVVPAGHTLFITDVSWQTLDNPTSLVAGRTLALELFAEDPNGANSRRVYVSSKVEITSSNDFAFPGALDSLTSGFAVGAGRIICPLVSNRSQTSFSRNTLVFAVLQGFLVVN